MAMDAENKPWIELAGALGKLLRHISEDQVAQNASVNIVTRGTQQLQCISVRNANEILSQFCRK